MQLKHFSLIFSIAGISVLYILSTLTQPIIIELNQLPQYEGKEVTVNGIITEHHVTKYDSQMITIENNNTSALVFIEGIIEIEYGDKIQATGKVQRYQEEWEIIVSDVRNINILQKWNNISMPLWQLAQYPTKYEDTNVNVTGYIDMIYGTYFYLIDDEGENSIIVFLSPSNINNIYTGQKVNIAAKFTFDQEHFRYILEITEERHGVFPTLEGY